MTMREFDVLSLGKNGFHRVAYTGWAEGRHDRTVVCVHGLTRNGRDFDALAGALQDDFQVACPDLPGRGRSDWLADAGQYALPTYMADMAAVVARLGTDAVDWIGTSLGGLVGIMLAAQDGTPIRRLVLNDIGPFVPQAALARIGDYVGNAPVFDDVEGIAGYLRRVHAGFGPLSDDEWRHLATHGGRRQADGTWRLHYDPAIATPFADGVEDDLDLWAAWDKVKCPVLVLRGGDSDTLLDSTAQAMRDRGPGAEVATFEGVGHAPALMADEQIATVRDWLLRSTG
jgi:pimeloyl-ACP methyl ester carboxylesterase